MDITRRFFIGGAAAFGAFGGCRFLATHDFRAGGKPNLRFGVVSDIHVRYVGGPGIAENGFGSTATLLHTLEWFRDQGADAVVIAGDMADFGMVDQLEAVADAWYRVFPDDRAPDGRRVEKVFVYGNHDYHGYLYGDFAAKKYPDEVERRRHVLRNDLKGNWERIFREEYSRFYRRDVNGYAFLGAHWDDGKDMSTRYGSSTFGVELGDFLNARGGTLDPALPFFYVQHPHPKDTCYGPWAWGHDDGKVTAALSAFPNAVAFSGHSHYSLTDERSVWQGAFTSVGTSSLRYIGMPYNMRHPVGYENTTTEAKGAWKYNAVKMTGTFGGGDCRQGMLWSVYDDCMTVRRREFLNDLDLGDDWVLPLPAAEPRPFAFVERARRFAAPEFAADAKLGVVRVKAKNRGGKSPDGKESIPSVEKDAFRITIPAPAVNRAARSYEFEVRAERKGAEAKVKYVMAVGFNHAPAHAKAKSATDCVFAADELAPGEVRFTVTPLNCYGRRGTSLSSDWFMV